MTENDEEFRPTWEEIQRWVYQRCGERSRPWTDQWLEEHPLDWLMVTRFLKQRVEDKIALAKAHRRMHVNMNGQYDEQAQQHLTQDRKTQMRRIALRNALDEQMVHAKFLLGNDRITSDTIADVLSMLTGIRSILVDDTRDLQDAVNALDAMMRNLHTRQPVIEDDDDEHRPA